MTAGSSIRSNKFLCIHRDHLDVSKTISATLRYATSANLPDARSRDSFVAMEKTVV